MRRTVPPTVDYRSSETGQGTGSCGNEPSALFDLVSEWVAQMHTRCWDVIRRETAARGLEPEYVVSDNRGVLLSSEHAWKTVTCPVCADTWRLRGYGLTGNEVVAVRQSLLAVVCLAV